jgi:hypothetical protein
MSTKAKPNFVAVNEGSLSSDAQSLLAKKREADKQSAAYRAELEAIVTKAAIAKGLVKADQTLLFGYRFGNFAIAVVNKADVEAKSASKNAISL